MSNFDLITNKKWMNAFKWTHDLPKIKTSLHIKKRILQNFKNKIFSLDVTDLVYAGQLIEQQQYSLHLWLT